MGRVGTEMGMEVGMGESKSYKKAKAVRTKGS